MLSRGLVLLCMTIIMNINIMMKVTMLADVVSVRRWVCSAKFPV